MKKKNIFKNSLLTLSGKQKKIFRGIVHNNQSPERVIRRARIILAIAKNFSIVNIARFFDITENTVRNTLRIFLEKGLEKALYDDPRSGRPRVLSIKQSQQIIACVCTNPPYGYARWSIRILTEHIRSQNIANVGRETIRILLKYHDFKPWREKMWCIPRLDEEYIKRMEDILNLYEKPYSQQEPVVCFDERPIVLHSEIRNPIPMKSHRVMLRDSEYKRCGTANAFCIVEPKAGRHFVYPTEKRTADDFAKIIKKIENFYPDANKIHLVLDNLNTHKEKSLIDYYGLNEGERICSKFTIHYTPNHGSWLNQAEIEISMYSKQCLGHDRIPNMKELKERTAKWVSRMNSKKIKINWKFTTSMARKKFKYKSEKTFRSEQ